MYILGIISLIFGIVALIFSCCGIITIIIGSLGLFFGILGCVFDKKKGLSIAGIICSAVAIIMCLLIYTFSAIIMESAENYKKENNKNIERQYNY